MKNTFALVLVACLAGAWSATAAEPKDNWEKNCASCHGKDGKAQTTAGKKIGAKDLTDAKVQADFTDEQAFKNLKEGVKKDGKEFMKPFADKLTDDEIKALVTFARAFKK